MFIISYTVVKSGDRIELFFKVVYTYTSTVLYENIFAITNTIFCLLLSNVLYGIYKRSSVMDHDEVMPLERNEAIEKCLQERQPLDLQNVLL